MVSVAVTLPMKFFVVYIEEGGRRLPAVLVFFVVTETCWYEDACLEEARSATPTALTINIIINLGLHKLLFLIDVLNNLCLWGFW